jgi:hypothetical protein
LLKPRSICLYGTSGTTKTSQSYHLIKWILSKPENQGKHFRALYSDGGGWAPFDDSGMVKRGEIDIFDFGSLNVGVLARFRWLSQGYWPKWAKDGKAYPKQIEGSTLYFQKEDVCKTTDAEWGKIAGYLIEGIESTCEALKDHCSDQTEGVGFKESWRYEEEGETIVGLQQGHYGIIQKEFHKAHQRGFNCLPIPWLIYTSKLGKGEDKERRETVYGPQIVGNAVTSSSPGWFMDVLHLSAKETYQKEGKEIEGMVAWFTQHKDAQTEIPYLCKARCLPELYPELLKQFPYGFVPLGFKTGVENYFKTLERLNGGNENAKTP